VRGYDSQLNLPNREKSHRNVVSKTYSVSVQPFLIHTKNKTKEGRSYCVCETCKHGLQGQCLDKRCKCCTVLAQPLESPTEHSEDGDRD